MSESTMFTMILSALVVLAAACGVIIRDWAHRRHDLSDTKALRAEAQALVTEYKSYLAKVQSIDTTRAEAMIKLAERIEALEMRMAMAKAQQVPQPKRA
jgi:uncharacterized membrane protein